MNSFDRLKAQRQQATQAGMSGSGAFAPGKTVCSISGLTEASSGTEGLPTKTMSCLAWICTICNSSCVPIRSESRCLCGHRLKEHKATGSGEHRCSSRGCACADFFFIVAEGSWVLRCSCKHKHTEHDPATHRCSKPKCTCTKFHSPWVCNCDHPWSAHKQVLVEKQVTDLQAMLQQQQLEGPVKAAALAAAAAAAADADLAPDVNRWDLIQRGSGTEF